MLSLLAERPFVAILQGVGWTIGVEVQSEEGYRCGRGPLSGSRGDNSEGKGGLSRSRLLSESSLQGGRSGLVGVFGFPLFKEGWSWRRSGVCLTRGGEAEALVSS